MRAVPARIIAFALLLTTAGHSSEHEENAMDHHHQHEHEHEHKEDAHGASTTTPQLVVTTDPATPVAGQAVTFRLMIHAPDGTMVRDFAVAHGEKVHLVVVREALDTFAHLHPTVDAYGNLTVTYIFPAGGSYRLFADYTRTGGEHGTATASLAVGGEAPPAPAFTADAPGEVVGDDLRATISAEPLTSRSAVRIRFALRDDRDGPVRLEPYMGELGHLMFIAVGSWRYVHVHPAGGDAAQGAVAFEAHFPEAGLYKGWGQFKQDGRVRVLPLAMRIE